MWIMLIEASRGLCALYMGTVAYDTPKKLTMRLLPFL